MFEKNSRKDVLRASLTLIGETSCWLAGEGEYDTMWGLVMKPFPKRYQKSDALQVQLCWVGARRSERWDP